MFNTTSQLNRTFPEALVPFCQSILKLSSQGKRYRVREQVPKRFFQKSVQGAWEVNIQVLTYRRWPWRGGGLRGTPECKEFNNESLNDSYSLAGSPVHDFYHKKLNNKQFVKKVKDYIWVEPLNNLIYLCYNSCVVESRAFHTNLLN